MTAGPILGLVLTAVPHFTCYRDRGPRRQRCPASSSRRRRSGSSPSCTGACLPSPPSWRSPPARARPIHSLPMWPAHPKSQLRRRLGFQPLTTNRIAFASNTAGGYSDIWTVSPQAGTPTRLTSFTGQEHSPSWSFDHTRIAFARTRNGLLDIQLMKADGTGKHWARSMTFPGLIDQPSWSPDGSHLLVRVSSQGTHSGQARPGDREPRAGGAVDSPRGQGQLPHLRPGRDQHLLPRRCHQQNAQALCPRRGGDDRTDVHLVPRRSGDLAGRQAGSHTPPRSWTTTGRST